MLFVPINNPNVIVDVTNAELDNVTLSNCTASGVLTIEEGAFEVQVPYTFA